MKGRRALWILLAVLAVLIALLIWVTRFEKTEQTEEETAASVQETDELTLWTVSEESITQISWRWQGTDTTLQKGTEWFWADQPDRQLDQDKVASVLQSLTEVTAARAVPQTVQEPAQFGLDEPVMTVQLAAAGSRYTIELGLRNTTYDQNYALFQGNGYLLGTDLYTPLAISVYSLLQGDTLPDISTDAITEATLAGKNGVFTLVQPKVPGAVSYSDSYAWFLADADGYTALKTTAVTNLLGEILNADLSGCVGSRTDGPDTDTWDLAAFLQYSDEENNLSGSLCVYLKSEDTEIISPGDEPDLQSAQESDAGVLLWMDDSDLIYQLSASDVQDLLQVDVQDLLPQDICAISFSELKSMVIEIDGRSCRFDMLAAEDGEISCTMNGTAVDQDIPATIFNRLKSLNVEGVAEDAPESAQTAALTIKFYRDRETWGVMTLQLLPYDASFYLVDFAGQQRLLVSMRDVDSLLDIIWETTILN